MSKKIFIILFFLVLFSLVLVVRFASPKAKTIVVLNKQTFSVDLADNSEEWARGLSGRASLSANQGMLFLYPDKAERSFWMKDMNFALDIIWLEDNKIIGWVADVPPPTAGAELERYLSPAPANEVLELPAGTAKLLNLTTGDLIEVKYD